MPAASWFGYNSTPTILAFEQESVAQGDAVRRPKLNEISISLPIQKKQHEQVLKQLRVRLVHVAGAKFQELKDIARLSSDIQQSFKQLTLWAGSHRLHADLDSCDSDTPQPLRRESRAAHLALAGASGGSKIARWEL